MSFTVITGAMRVVSSITAGKGGSNEAERKMQKSQDSVQVSIRERASWEIKWGKWKSESIQVCIQKKKEEKWKSRRGGWKRRQQNVITKLFNLWNNKRYAGLSFSLSFFPLFISFVPFFLRCVARRQRSCALMCLISVSAVMSLSFFYFLFYRPVPFCHNEY